MLTSAWIAVSRQGERRHVSFVDLLTLEATDGEELVHVRDDVRFFTRALLAALAQALFPTRDLDELAGRLGAPMERDGVEATVTRVAGDFALLGDGAFLQSAVAGAAEEGATGKLLPGVAHDLFRPPTEFAALCPRCAPACLYGAQAFAAAGGRGYSPGVRGAPPVTTLVRAGSVRRDVWANTLPASMQRAYPPSPPRPWKQEEEVKTAETVGLVEGLFWQPRSLSLKLAPDGACDACGEAGERVELGGIAKKSKVAGGFFRHPWSPWWSDASPKAKRAAGCFNLHSDRPAWTDLADMLTETSGVGRAAGSREPHPAAVVHQWRELGIEGGALAVFDVSYNKAALRSRFSLDLPLTARVLDQGFGEDLRNLSRLAEDVLRAVRFALGIAAGGRGDGPGWNAARPTFWQSTEGALTAIWEPLYRAPLDVTQLSVFHRALARAATHIYRDQTAALLSDSRSAPRVARGEVVLRRQLTKLDPTVPAEEIQARKTKAKAKSAKKAKAA